MALMEVICFGDDEMLRRPCVDCGLITGSFCDYCRAADRLPHERWAAGQMTPLCSHCDRRHGCCHFCRKQHWVTPPPSTGHRLHGIDRLAVYLDRVIDLRRRIWGVSWPVAFAIFQRIGSFLVHRLRA
jgi:hypothetical protein